MYKKIITILKIVICKYLTLLDKKNAYNGTIITKLIILKTHTNADCTVFNVGT